MKAVIVALVVSTTLVGSITAGSAQFAKSRSFTLGPGPAHRVFTMRQPQGVVLLTRLTTTVGVRASVAATIRGVAGVRVANYGNLGAPSPCRRRGPLVVCTQSQQWCPMPKAAWRVHVVKAGGPAGLVRFDFVVGAPPRR